jgi:hypothetical protein
MDMRRRPDPRPAGPAEGLPPPCFVGHAGAVRRFLQIFEDGLRGDAYLRRERQPKDALKARLDAAAPLAAALRGQGLAGAVEAIGQAGLLAPFEQQHLQALLDGPAAGRFIQGAASFTVGGIREGLAQMEDAMAPHGRLSWPLATCLPFLWRPDCHLLLKPQLSRDFARHVGHELQRSYAARPTAAGYASFMDLAQQSWRALVLLEPRDFIDIHNVMWVVIHYRSHQLDG